MKLITAIIKPFKLDDVRQAVGEVGVQGNHGNRSARLRPATRPHGEIAVPNISSSSFRRRKSRSLSRMRWSIK